MTNKVKTGQVTNSLRSKTTLLMGVLILACAIVAGLEGHLFSRVVAALPQNPSGDASASPQINHSPSSDRAHPKLDTPLTGLAQMEREAPAQVPALAQSLALRLDPSGNRVQVQLKVSSGAEDTVGAAVTAAGGEVTGRYQSTLQAWLPSADSAAPSIVWPVSNWRTTSPDRLSHSRRPLSVAANTWSPAGL